MQKLIASQRKIMDQMLRRGTNLPLSGQDCFLEFESLMVPRYCDEKKKKSDAEAKKKCESAPMKKESTFIPQTSFIFQFRHSVRSSPTNFGYQSRHLLALCQ